MEKPRLFDIPLGTPFEIFVLIKTAAVKQDRNGRSFIAFNFQDKSGTIDGMYWSAKEEEVNKFKSGHVVSLRGTRDMYNGQPQVRITGLRLANSSEPDDPTLYVEEGPMSQEDMHKEIDYYISEITHPKIHKIVTTIMTKLSPDFYSYPAAKRHHHAFVGGLGFHTISMLRLTQVIYKQYPSLDKSLLYGGAMLHDAAKVIEFSHPMTTEYTLEGNLIGHISLMAEEIALAAEELGLSQEDEAVTLLKHMVLSHHGYQEYGSPIRPQLMEAEIVHQVDNLDATIQMLLGAYNHTENGEFSQRVHGLDGRSFYKPTENFYQNK